MLDFPIYFSYTKSYVVRSFLRYIPNRSGRYKINNKVERSSRRKNTVSRKFINNVRKFREQFLMSKAELAREAGLSVLTVDRVERGRMCRMATKRKIIKALGFAISDKNRVFGKS